MPSSGPRRDLLRARRSAASASASAGRAASSAAHAKREVESLLLPINGRTTKIPQNEILDAGPTPVVTQEQDGLIAGYADHTDVIDDVPLLVFGDHTCVLKYVDFPFLRGADGTQLLKVNAAVALPKYLLHILRHAEIPNAGKYERHFKYLKAMRVPVPPLPEQKRLVAEIERHEAHIATARATLAAAPAQKEAILKMYL